MQYSLIYVNSQACAIIIKQNNNFYIFETQRIVAYNVYNTTKYNKHDGEVMNKWELKYLLHE